MAHPASDKQQILARLKSASALMDKTHLSEVMALEGREKLVLKWQDLWVDITRQHLTPKILADLYLLADACDIRAKINALYAGEAINQTENRAVEHLNLRHPDRKQTQEWKQLSGFVEKIRTEGQIKSVVNIGIGGSDLGPAMLSHALAPYIAPIAKGPELHFVGNVDPSHLYDILAQCRPNETLFIITSKTFTTAETMANARLAKDWLIQHGVEPKTALVGVTAAPDKAASWGVDRQMIFDFADGVGGRYSMWSAVGLSVMLGCGVDIFSELLDGAHHADTHVYNADWSENLALNLALIRYWQRHFRDARSYGLMAYDQRLCRFAAWAQQLEMESNGKSVRLDGTVLSQPAAPLIWGEPGTNAQHSFFQWLHQGLEANPIDILIPRNSLSHGAGKGWQDSHRKLVINAIAQAEALAIGNQNSDSPHRHFAGNRPSVMISWDKSTPFAIGRLLSIYEHVTILSGFLWEINSFDQFGVELGKKMAIELENEPEQSQFSKAALELLSSLENKS